MEKRKRRIMGGRGREMGEEDNGWKRKEGRRGKSGKRSKERGREKSKRRITGGRGRQEGTKTEEERI